MQHLKEGHLIKPKPSFFTEFPINEKYEFLKIKMWKPEYNSVTFEVVDDEGKSVFTGWMENEKLKHYFHIDINDKISNAIVVQSFVKFVGITPDGQTVTIEM